jgi:hypothetical protein
VDVRNSILPPPLLSCILSYTPLSLVRTHTYLAQPYAYLYTLSTSTSTSFTPPPPAADCLCRHARFFYIHPHAHTHAHTHARQIAPHSWFISSCGCSSDPLHSSICAPCATDRHYLSFILDSHSSSRRVYAYRRVAHLHTPTPFGVDSQAFSLLILSSRSTPLEAHISISNVTHERHIYTHVHKCFLYHCLLPTHTYQQTYAEQF